MNNILKYTAVVLSAMASCSSFAANTSMTDDYGSSFYDEGGRIQFKARILGALSRGAQTNLPPLANADNAQAKGSNGHFMANGFGAEGVTTIFFGRRFATELGVGLTLYKISRNAINYVAQNYGNAANIGRAAKLYTIPVTFTAQYHIAPFGAIRPYIGAGYSAAYALSRSKAFNAKNAHGAVAQLGVDFVMTDDSLINLDIRKYNLSHKILYKSSIVSGTNIVSSKIKVNPWVIGLGFGMRF